MKTTLLFLLLSLLATTSYSQVSTPTADSTSYSKEYLYLKKSKTQRTVGRVLVIGGGVLLVAGYGALLGEAMNGTGQSSRSDLLLNSSIVSIITGSVFMFSAKRNRKKAMSATVGHAPYAQPFRGTFTTQSAPTIGLRIAF